MTEATSDHRAPASPALCENCGTVLQGGYCHVCGQRAHNPLHHFGHAVEEVFESFWHLDGRIFRSLVDLLVPGRVAARYLAGHRVRYVAPLRLFLIMTVLAFFVGQLTVRMERPNVSVGNNAAIRTFDRAKTVAEVERQRDLALKELASVPDLDDDSPFAEYARNAASDEVRSKADARIRELKGLPPALEARGRGMNIRLDGDGWDPRTDKVDIPWVPQAVDHWLEAKARRAVANAERVSADPDAFAKAWMRVVPTTLFLLVPLFALLLKLFHLFSGRSYLEHLVVALYSHAWLMQVLLLLFLGAAIADAGGDGVLGTAAGWFTALLWLAIPVYLLLMQKRIYRQSWWWTLPKYVALGSAYTVMLASALLIAMAIGLVEM